MSDAISRTRKRGRPPTGAISLHVKVPPDQLARLDSFIGSEAPGISRPEAVRRLVALALAQRDEP